MHDWIGQATRVGSIAQRLLRRWLFEAEFLGGSRTVYTYERGDSPFVNIGFSIRVHNRNHAPTTVYVRSIAVRLANGTERGLERAVMIRPGPIHSMDGPEEFNCYEVPGCSTVELTLFTRKNNPQALSEYLEGSSLEIVLELGETFGGRRKLVGSLQFGGICKQ